jgi:hypothetical protein
MAVLSYGKVVAAEVDGLFGHIFDEGLPRGGIALLPPTVSWFVSAGLYVQKGAANEWGQ